MFTCLLTTQTLQTTRTFTCLCLLLHQNGTKTPSPIAMPSGLRAVGAPSHTRFAAVLLNPYCYTRLMAPTPLYCWCVRGSHPRACHAPPPNTCGMQNQNATAAAVRASIPAKNTHVLRTYADGIELARIRVGKTHGVVPWTLRKTHQKTDHTDTRPRHLLYSHSQASGRCRRPSRSG